MDINEKLDRFIESLMLKTLPSIRREFKEYVADYVSRKLQNQSRLIRFDGYANGKPNIPNPSLTAWYQNSVDGSRWYYDGVNWHKLLTE